MLNPKKTQKIPQPETLNLKNSKNLNLKNPNP